MFVSAIVYSDQTGPLRHGKKHDDDRTAQAGGQREARSPGSRHETSKAYLASEAIEAYVDVNVWQVAHIKEAREEDESGASGVPQEEVVAWMESWGTGHELLAPKPKRS